MKFGGTSVGDVAAFQRLVAIVSSQVEKDPVIVVSAMTKVTDALLAAFETARKGDADPFAHGQALQDVAHESGDGFHRLRH
jgi:aspartate kinase